MKNYFLTAILALSLATVFAQNSKDEMEVRKLNAALDEAIKVADVAVYESLLAPDYISYGSNGTVKNRSQVLDEVKKQKENPSYKISKMSSDDVKVKMAGYLAVVTAKWNATTQSMDTNEPHDDSGHYMAVYEKRNGKWQLTSEMGNEKPHTPEELEPSLKEASQNYDDAIEKRDKEAFARLLAENYSSTNTEGKVHNREQDIAMMFNPDLKIENASVVDKEFKVFRNFAVETGKYNVTGTYKGEKFTETGRYTSTWMFKDGKWEMVADHTSTIQPQE